MSVLIKGMDMPRSCANCEWSSLSKMDLGMSMYCKLTKKTENLEVAKNCRVEFCPLVEVPTPHGRLIDVDELIVIGLDDPDCNTLFEFVPKEFIDNAEVIIEAEEEE